MSKWCWLTRYYRKIGSRSGKSTRNPRVLWASTGRGKASINVTSRQLAPQTHRSVHFASDNDDTEQEIIGHSARPLTQLDRGELIRKEHVSGEHLTYGLDQRLCPPRAVSTAVVGEDHTAGSRRISDIADFVRTHDDSVQVAGRLCTSQQHAGDHQRVDPLGKFPQLRAVAAVACEENASLWCVKPVGECST